MTASLLPRAIALALFASLTLPLACGDTEDSSSRDAGSSSGGTVSGSGGVGNGGADSGSAGEGATAATGRGGSTMAQGGQGPMAGAGLVPGLSDSPETIECEAHSCDSALISSLGAYVPPCCAGPSESACGLDTTILAGIGSALDPACQARAQPGPLDAACPASEPRPVSVPTPIGNQSLPIDFPGCCREATGTCGYLVDTIKASGFTVGYVGLGCVDAGPWLDGAAAKPCGGEGGAGQEASGGVSGGGGAGDADD